MEGAHESGVPFPLAETILEALENASIGVTIFEDRADATRRVYANDALARLFGVTREALMNTPAMAPLADEGRARVHAMREASRRGETVPTRFETSARRGDGSEIPIEVSLATARYADRLAVIVFFRDLSERQRMESALRESEERFRKLAEVSPDTIAVIAGGRMVYANPAAARVLGFPTPEELVARPLSQLVDESESALMISRIRQVMAGEVIPPVPYRGRRKDGSIAVMEISSIATQFDGKPAVAAFGRDVTERTALLKRVLQQDRLAAVGLLAAGVAHELNNPLTYVTMQLRRALADLDDARDDADLRGRIRAPIVEALEGAEQIGGVVRELLSLARDENITRAGVDIGTVVRSAVKFTLTTGAFDIAVKQRIDAIPEIETNAARFGQVVINVLTNALQVSREVGRSEVRVAVHLSGTHIVTEIADDGSGIAPEDLDRVMDPFFTTRPPGAGTGLGLTISHSIMRSLGGTIHIASKPGSGTTVRLELPVHPANASPVE